MKLTWVPFPKLQGHTYMVNKIISNSNNQHSDEKLDTFTGGQTSLSDVSTADRDGVLPTQNTRFSYTTQKVGIRTYVIETGKFNYTKPHLHHHININHPI